MDLLRGLPPPAGRRALRYGAVLGMAACLAGFGDPPEGLAATGQPTSKSLDDPTYSTDAAPDAVRPALPMPGTLPGNPLWAVPLQSLSVTQERPLFSASRRPPIPAVVAAPYVPPAPPAPKPVEPDHPLLSLVGTVVSETDGSIGIFIDQATQGVVRLKTGQDHAGWVLRSVRGRDVAFEKERQHAILALPARGVPLSDQVSVPPPPTAQAAITTHTRVDNGWAWAPGANN